MRYQNRLTTKVYFITTTVINWIDIFTRPVYKHIILDSLKHCQEKKGLILYGWVLMPNHIHLLAGNETEETLSFILRDFKKFTSKEIVRTLQTDPQESRREWMLDKFYFAGRNDKKIKEFKFWQEGIDIHELTTNDFLTQKLNYIHNNPIKSEFVIHPEDYLYSSAIDYAGGKGLLNITHLTL